VAVQDLADNPVRTFSGIPVQAEHERFMQVGWVGKLVPHVLRAEGGGHPLAHLLPVVISGAGQDAGPIQQLQEVAQKRSWTGLLLV